jgi:hypothetical protein
LRPLLEYCTILINIYSFRKKGSINTIYSMVKVSCLLVPITKNPRMLKKKRFYPLSIILRNAYLIPAFLELAPSIYYINNYINQD